MKKIAIVGKGNVGGALGARLSNSGYAIRFGVRGDKDISEILKACNESASSASPSDAVAWADVVFLAVPGKVTVSAATDLADELNGKVLVDCNNLLSWDSGPVWTPPAEGSLSAAIAEAVPGTRVVKGFNTFGSEFHGNPQLGDTSADVFLASDDANAKEIVAAIAETAGFHAVDSGPLRNAAVLENLAMLWIHLAMVGGQGREAAFKLVHR